MEGRHAQSIADRHLCIVGLMGVGKSTVARLVARRLGRPVVDSDPWIEAATGATGREIATRDGVEALHRLEADMLASALARSDPSVITPAASVVRDAASLQLMDSAAFVAWLDLDPATAFERSQAGSHRRPTTIEDFRRMFVERSPAFERVADLRLDATRTPTDLAAEIEAALLAS